MNYGEIKNCDIANGIGVRVTLFVSGCTHHCKGCFNAQTWDFAYGKPYTKETGDDIISLLSKDFIAGLTLLGGEPFEPENQAALVPLLKRVRAELPQKNIWAYSGYTFDTDMLNGKLSEFATTREMLENIDVLVDGEFIEEKKNIRLKFRGSENQRIIDVPASLKTGGVVLLRGY